ncbi:dTDP-4-dehydrorhamnose reductase [Frigidibacter sp. MR17.14]|uniref:dTDP-4-dehydrorhamnose reductase n=1 Tax=Frigidibacter sp. MR17.14 TaxID=3126509 RepID=UPI00301310DC
MKLLVFGRTGQLATELAALAGPGLSITCLDRTAADLSDPEACAAVMQAAECDAAIIAAAWTAVDRAEAEEAAAALVNGASPAAIAQVAAARGIPLLHVSTDYVFDGQGTAPWKPSDPTGPLGAYGRTKLAGEDGLRAAGGPHAILRTSWVVSSHGANFVKTMLRLSETRNHLTVVADQIGGPTPARAIAAALVDMARQLLADPSKSGTYHFSGAPDVSWAEFARAIFVAADRDVTVEDIPTSAFPTPARRPANSRMDCDDLARVFGITRPDWRAELEGILAELGLKTPLGVSPG